MPQAYLVFNPTAGRFPLKPFVERAANVLRSSSWNIELVRASDVEHLRSTARRAADEGMDAVFIAGGDGSLNHVISGLVGSQTALAVLPAGTANVWAKELGLPTLGWGNITALEASAQLLAQGEFYNIDIGVYSDRPFLLWASIGLDAEVIRQLEPRKRWEKHFAVPQYAATTVWQASSWKGMDLHVDNGQEIIQGRYMLAVVTNIHLYAGGLANLSPEARINDGKMDLWLFSGENLTGAIRHILALLAGEHVDSKWTRCISFQELKIKSAPPVYVQLDGEPIEEVEEIHIHVEPKALRILVPKDIPQQLFK